MSEIKVHRCFVAGQYGQLHIRVAGQVSHKPAIICLHMVPKSGRSFHQILPYLAADRLVIAADYPGYGESDAPPEEYPVRVEDYAEAILQVSSHFDLPTINLLGYHTGSMVAVEIARQRPELVEKLINISAPVFTAAEIDSYRHYFSPIPLDRQGERFRIMWERIMEYRGPGMTLEMAAVSMAENLRGGEYYERGHQAAFDYADAYARHIAEIDQPLLVMNLNDDLYEQTCRIDPLLNKGIRKDFPDWGTGFLDVFPQQVAQEILAFFDQGF